MTTPQERFDQADRFVTQVFSDEDISRFSIDWPTHDNHFELQRAEAMHYAKSFICEGFYLKAIKAGSNLRLVFWEYEDPEPPEPVANEAKIGEWRGFSP